MGETMKFCYVDESGSQNDRFLVMAGIIVDATRMHVTKGIWVDFLDLISEAAGRRIEEFHTRDLYSGSGPWHKVDGQERTKIITAVIKWVSDRKHHLTWSAVDNDLWKQQQKKDVRLQQLGTPWRTASFHIVLSLQKRFQTEEKTKGHVVCVFDHKSQEETAFPRLICSPPEWSGTYYSHSKKYRPLDQIVDVPHFVDSELAVLIQIADLVAYVLRRFTELKNGFKERYQGESKTIEGWVQSIRERAIPQKNRFLQRGRCETMELFWNLAPNCLRN
jgi:hypothetical protein